VLAARDPDRLAALADSLKNAEGVAAPFVYADLRRDDAVDTLMEGLRAKVPSIDDLVLACGPFPRTPFATLTRADLVHTLTVHAIAPLLLAHDLAADLTAAQGAVVALSDAGVTRPFTNHVAYLTAKGALQTGLRALAVELAPDVRVNVVAMGIVSDPEADDDPLRTHRLATRSPLGRFGTPEDVVHATLALLDASWSTGEIWGIGR
jgi:pteridine reductase